MYKTTAEINTMIASLGYPYEYYDFIDEPPPADAETYLTFFYPEGHDLYADGRNYSYIDELHIIAWRNRPDLHDDRRIVQVLNDNELTVSWERGYDKESRRWMTEFVTEVAINEDSQIYIYNNDQGGNGL